MNYEVHTDELRRKFDPEDLGIEDTSELEHLKGIIGQKRAVNALQFGLKVKGIGFNIFVAGPPGVGKIASVKSFVEDMAKEKTVPPDWCYVNNFEDSYNPRAIKLPAGKGCEFREDMNALFDHVQKDLPKVFESDEYTARREEIVNELTKRRDAISEEINQKASEEGFVIQPTPIGIMIIPLKNGRPLSDEEFQSLPESVRKEIQEKQSRLQNELKGVMKNMRKLEHRARESVKELDQKVALHVVGELMDDLIEKYDQSPEIKKFLHDVQDDILRNIDMFKVLQQKGAAPSPFANVQLQVMQETTLRKYQVNVLIDNSKQKGGPVILELNPTYHNLVGRIEKEVIMGALTTDFTQIKAGSLLRANGGFLIISIEDVLRNFQSWEALKRALYSCDVQIEELGERLGFMTTKTLRPQPIPIDVKVVLVGQPIFYRLLYFLDHEFAELFKVKADFDTRMDTTRENMNNFMSFISTFCSKEKIRHLDNAATADVMEYASRLAEDKEKLSTKFGHLADILREANFWSMEDGEPLIRSRHIRKTLDEKIYRSNLIEERIREMIDRGLILIDTAGEKVGQVNGLSVINLGDYQFGKPNRITATVEPGHSGIIDIEREVKLAGPIYSKGVLIVSGYLVNKYMQGKPTTLTARLVFEQSYEGVEGDSASAAELYSLLSVLAEVPIKQGIAVTGSVNQVGQVQAVGGINYKIEGYYDVCRVKGLTGNQGVIIPRSNVRNLILRKDVAEAVISKKFTIWTIDTIDEGIELLTGMVAGERQEDGTFPPNTFNEKVSKKLDSFEETLRRSKVFSSDMLTHKHTSE
ncbi:MAG: ATP-binding protein [wastewater metagenome]|nr:ATP-binding protein [Candidatus Loosdrechtia aerotolerans]